MTTDSAWQERYGRQIKLPEVGESGQWRLQQTRVLIIGMGGLGSPVALYLAAAGIGHLVISDFDCVDRSNLQRQIAHGVEDIDDLKARSAARAIRRLNPETKLDVIDYALEDDELEQQVKKADILVDCSDNFPTRFELNAAAFRNNTPLVSGAAIRWEGQVATFDPRQAESPCYHCLYQDEGVEGATCAMEGVIAPVVGIIGTMQALEVLHLALQTGHGLVGRILLFDGTSPSWHEVKLPKNPACPVCGHRD